VALGALLLSSAATHATRSRARYASSDPPSGAILASPPAAVRVRFDRALDPSSSLYVDRTAPGEAALRVGVSSGLDPADPERRTLRADLAAAPAGRYRLQWHALPASGGGVARFGSLVFAAGLPALPEDEPTFEEHDSGQRRWRRTVAGGAIFVLLGLLLSRLPRPR
jgi:methionine-rich copper-binding protein CopC